MEEINLKQLVFDLINKEKITEIYAFDGDNEYHNVSSIDLMREMISCDDGWYQYFDSFEEGYSRLFVIR